MKKAVNLLLFIVSLLSSLTGCAQRPTDSQKIDPVLQAQLKEALKEEEKTKRYPCIIYTKEPGSLQKTGVHLDSVFPTFVTARLTKKEILQLSKTKQVTYIASPKPDQLHSDGL